MLPANAPTRPNPAVRRPREAWHGSLAVAASLLLLGACLCAAGALALADRLPTPLDAYMLARVGEASLYRATYADGSQGFLTVNIVPPSTDSLAYAALMAAGGRAVEAQYTYSNWQGTGTPYARDEFLVRFSDRLLLLGISETGPDLLYEPPLLAWSGELLSATEAEPIVSQSTLNGQPVEVRAWRAGDERVSLPGGGDATAVRVASTFASGGAVLAQAASWLVPGVGQVRYEETDAAGALFLRLDLLNSTRLHARGLGDLSREAAAALPLAELVSTGSEAAFFRGGLARTGAHPEVAWPAEPLAPAYRLQTGTGVTASPLAANGLFYVADQSGLLSAIEAFQAAPRWTFAAGGPIVASPALAGGVLYVGAADKRLYALDAQHGHYLWSVSLSDNVATSPVVVDSTLYFGGEDRTLYALDARTSAERWRFTAAGRIVSSPAAAGGRVFFGAGDGVVYALDAGSGSALWRAALDAAVEATVAVSPEGVVYAASRGTRLAAFDAATGEERWTVDSRFGYLASPVVSDGRVFVADMGGRVRAYEAATGALLWEQAAADAVFAASPLLVGQRLIAADTGGTVYVFDAATGEQLQALDLGEGYTASPVWAGEAVLLADSRGDLAALQPGARTITLTPLWQAAYGSAVDISVRAQPIPAGGELYLLPYDGTLWAVDPASSRGQDLEEMGDEVLATPAFVNGVLYVATQNGTVIAYDPARDARLWAAAVDGLARFGPAVMGDYVLVPYIQPEATAVRAFDLATGAQVWERSFGDGSATPVLAGGYAIVAGRALTALDPATGDLVWQSEPFVTLGALAAHEEVVYAGGTGEAGTNFIAVEAATGATLWRSAVPGRFEYAPPLYEPENDIVLAGTYEGTLYAFDAASGDVRWRFQADDSLQAPFAARDGVAYVTAASGSLYALDAATGRLLAHYRPGTNISTLAGPVLLGDRLFTPHGMVLHALTLADTRP